MTQKTYNTIWGTCAAIIVASAYGFDHMPNNILKNIMGVIALIAALVCLVSHFRMYSQFQKEDE